MTPQESKMLEDLIARVDATRLEEKDPEAAQHVDQWIARNHDAAYILAQTVLVQNYALEQAKQQIQRLQQQAQQQPASSGSKSGSFLGALFGHKEEPQQPQRSAAPPAYAQQQPGYAPVPQYGQQYPPQGYPSSPAYAAPGTAPGTVPGTVPGTAPGGGGSSFLRSAATTAAGVAAGALAFEGVESLMHGFGHAAGFGGGGFGGGGLGDFGGRPEETIVNNYYDTPAPGSSAESNADIDQYAHAGESDLSTQQDLADDVNVGGDDAQLQADNDLPTLDESDSGFNDDASLDDSSFDDGGGDLS
jgi:hypothetical protein